MYLEPWKTRFHAFCAVGISNLKNHMKQKTTYAEETRTEYCYKIVRAQ